MKRHNLSLLIVGLLASCWGHTLRAQSTGVEVRLDTVTINVNEAFDYPIRVSGLENIISGQFGLVWDSTVVTMEGVSFFSPQGDSSRSFRFNIFSGRFRVLFDASLTGDDGVTYPDGAIIAVAQMRAVGPRGSSTAVSPEPGFDTEMARLDGTTLPLRILDGRIHLQGSSSVTEAVRCNVRTHWTDPNTMNIRSNLPAGAIARLYSTDGREVGRTEVPAAGAGSIHFDSAIAPGLYVLRITTETMTAASFVPGPG